MKDLKDFPVFFYFNRFYDNSNPSASFNFSRFGFFLLIIWKITMTVRVSAPTENIRAYSHVERFQMMSKKNPNLLNP